MTRRTRRSTRTDTLVPYTTLFRSLADAQHREEDESDQRRADRRGKAQGVDQRDRKQHAEHAREEVREEPKAIGQRRVLDPLHATLRICDVDQDALNSCLLDLGDPTFREPVGVIARYVLQERSEEHTSELQSLIRISYAVFCLKKKNKSKSTQQLPTTFKD